MYFELVVADALKTEAKNPDCETDICCPSHCIVRSVNYRKETCCVNDEAKQALYHKNIDESFYVVPSLVCPASTHVYIAIIFLSMAGTDVVSEAETPD